MPFPGLRAVPWWPGSAFSWSEALELGASVVSEEFGHFQQRISSDAIWEKDVSTNLCADTGGFAKLVLWEEGQPTQVGAHYFQGTLELLRRAGVPVAPRPISINRQDPGSGLAPHSDNLNFVLVCHVGIHVPSGCRFRMHSGVTPPAQRWSVGKVLVADTSFIHSTSNDSQDSRYVLHFTIWHPDLTEAERAGIVRLHEALQAAEDESSLRVHGRRSRTPPPSMAVDRAPSSLGRRHVILRTAHGASLAAMAPTGMSAVDVPSPGDLSRIAYANLGPCPPATQRLILCRHGRTLLNQLGLPQGQLIDAPLDATGRAQAAALGRVLARGQALAVVGSSSRLRAIQTADGISIAALPRVREPPRNDLDEVFDYIAGDPTPAYVDTRLRAAAVLIALRRALQPGESGVWVSHSRFLRVVLAAAAAEEAKVRGAGFLAEWKAAFPPGFRLRNGALSVIDVSERGVFSIRCANSVAHLSDA